MAFLQHFAPVFFLYALRNAFVLILRIKLFLKYKYAGFKYCKKHKARN